MFFTETTWNYFSLIPFKVRSSTAKSKSLSPFIYDDSFFKAYNAVQRCWKHGQSQRGIAKSLEVGRDTLKIWKEKFLNFGTIGLLQELNHIECDTRLEKLVVLIKTARPHEDASHTLRLADALELPGASLDLIRRIQRCHGYGQNLDEDDIKYFKGLQHILTSIDLQKKKPFRREKSNGAKYFFDFEHDSLQQRVELFRTIAELQKKRQIRPILKQYGIHPNRYYILKKRYMSYGIWGLVDLIQVTKRGELISPELELEIIEQRLMNPKLSTLKMIKELNLKCSKAHVQKVYSRWKLASFKKVIPLRGVISQKIPGKTVQSCDSLEISAKSRFPHLVEEANLKVNCLFKRFVKKLSYHKVIISNPGSLIIAPFLEQLGVVEAMHTYGPLSFRSGEITNSIIANVLRIIAGFPTISNFTLNCDRSVAIAAGLSLTPKKSRLYDSFDELRFMHLQQLRNDASCRAKELNVIEGKEIAIDYHCDASDSRFPNDKSQSKSPDKNGNLVYAHRPQILWDSITNTIINIAYCEGRSRAPTALYQFCEENLFKVIDPDAITEIYADSEYTGEKQLIYLTVRSVTDVTMCLKQNPKIKKWKEKTIRKGQWEKYGQEYRIASMDFVLPETGKPLRFVVKENTETGEVRCFGSTHTDYSPKKILNSYHIRWPVETGIKDLIENYFLNKPTGTSPEKVEAHYYCVMLARLAVDYFRSKLCVPEWRTPEDWQCVLSTIRTTIFSNQNCELSIDDNGDFLITYLDSDPHGIKNTLSNLLQKWKESGINKVSWWGNRGIQIQVKDQYEI